MNVTKPVTIAVSCALALTACKKSVSVDTKRHRSGDNLKALLITGKNNKGADQNNQNNRQQPDPAVPTPTPQPIPQPTPQPTPTPTPEPAPAPQPTPTPQPEKIAEYDTTIELMSIHGLRGKVRTKGHESVDDGAGMMFTIEDTLPDSRLGRMAVPLPDGKWAVPYGFKTAPGTAVDADGVARQMARAQTFVDAGNELIWDASRHSPVYDKFTFNVRANYQKPYPITCSAFLNLVLQGYDYQHSTYARDTNERIDPTHRLCLSAASGLQRCALVFCQRRCVAQ
ncbi:hypothetical protein [Kingella oralis]|uniref:hypothetical protein n=1 Tax=Kingella oralis TaxID=505 RepID=UPI0034E5158D